jgi:E3 ubiquitin-protein ligase NEDD4-like
LELQKKLLGLQVVDIDAWRQRAIVHPSECANHPVVEFFWEYAKNLENKDRSDLLFWLTGYRCVPAGTFPFVQRIHVVQHLTEKHLPVAHTCGFSVEIPAYSSAEVLKERFSYVLQAEPGFHLA